MIFAETVIQIDSASLIAGLGAAGTAIAGGIVGAAKILSGQLTKVEATLIRLHEENRTDRNNLQETVNSQWEHLNRLAQSSRVTAQAARSVQKKIGAEPVPEEEIP